MLPLPPLAVGAGQLLGPAFACGLNLYATVALIGIASRFGWTDAVPFGLRGLEHPLVIGSALALYGIEFVVDKVRFLDSAWDAVHTLIRPAAAALLAVLAFDSGSLAGQVALGATAGMAALTAHGLKAGLRMRLNEEARPNRTAVVSVAEDVLAASIALAALTMPEVAAGITLAILLLVVLLGPRLVRPAIVGVRMLDARLRGFFGVRGWRGRAALPAPLRRLIPPTRLGGSEPLATRAALLRGDNGGSYRVGWIVVDEASAAFLYRRFFGARRLDLPASCTATLHPGLLADVVELQAERGDLRLLLLKDGPDARVTMAALTRVRI